MNVTYFWMRMQFCIVFGIERSDINIRATKQRYFNSNLYTMHSTYEWEFSKIQLFNTSGFIPTIDKWILIYANERKSFNWIAVKLKKKKNKWKMKMQILLLNIMEEETQVKSSSSQIIMLNRNSWLSICGFFFEMYSCFIYHLSHLSHGIGNDVQSFSICLAQKLK